MICSHVLSAELTTNVSYFEMYTKNQIKAVKAFLLKKNNNMENVLCKLVDENF